MISEKMRKHLDRIHKLRIGSKHSDETKKKIGLSRRDKIGIKSSNWRGGKIIVDGYYYTYSPEHPNKTKDKYVCEHRLVMEKKLGRYLDKSEVVHHINHNKLDNRIENLVLFHSSGEHSLKEHVHRNPITGRFS